MTTQLSRVALTLVVGLLTTIGCQQEQPAPPAKDAGTSEATSAVDPHDIPLTESEIEALKTGLVSYQDALAKVKFYRDAIRDAIAAGNPLEAHRPLDELDIVLEYLPTLAREKQIPKSEWETINTAAQRIRELFNQVHTQIDAGDQPDYQAVADEVNSHITALEGVATS